jgi:hypothetical protein
LVRESGVDPAAQAGACTVSAGMWGAGGGGDVQEEKGEEEAEEGLRVDFDEDRGHFLQNGQNTSDLDRAYARSDGRQKRATWPRSPPTFCCANPF